jgi:hypothetical protein
MANVLYGLPIRDAIAKGDLVEEASPKRLEKLWLGETRSKKAQSDGGDSRAQQPKLES